MNKSSITKDTVVLSVISVALQGLSLLLNIFITKKLGEAAVGITSLIYSFFFFALILSNGNIFTSTSRFVSEEIGKGNGNVEKIMGYSLKFGLILSFLFAAVFFIFAGRIGKESLKSDNAVIAIRLMAMSLPLATVGSCLKGYFHAKRHIKVPCISDIIEFFIKAASVAFFAAFFIPQKRLDIFTSISLSIITGEIASCIYLSVSYLRAKESVSENPPSIKSFWRYIAAIFPIAISGYIFVVLSGANEALVPLTLKQFSGSSEIALSEYGIFEAIILPIIFFPSTFLQNLSFILIPEIARENSANNKEHIKQLTNKVIREGFKWSILTAFILFSCGTQIGALACDNPLAGQTIKILCPVIPFIYLEMLLEGILKGLGKQNFSTINSAAEYIIRISCVLIFVPLIGFAGIIISYFASNITCNIIRIIAVLKASETEFDFINFIFVPLFSALFGSEISSSVIKILNIPDGIMSIIVYTVLISVSFYIIGRFLSTFTKAKENLCKT